MSEPTFNKGVWRDGNTVDSIVTDMPEGIARDEIADFYGGYVIAETVSGNNKPLIKAAPDMYRVLENLTQMARAWQEDFEAMANDPSYKSNYNKETTDAIEILAKVRGAHNGD